MAATYCPQCGTPRVGAFRYCASCQFDYDDAAIPTTPTPILTPAEPSAPPASANAKDTTPALVILAGGALGVVGSFLPWITATVALAGTIERNGIDGGGDGIFTLIAGGLVILAGIARLAGSGSVNATRLLSVVGGAAMVGLAVIDYGSVADRVAEINGDYAVASVGTGIYVVGLGGILAMVGGLLSGRSATSK